MSDRVRMPAVLVLNGLCALACAVWFAWLRAPGIAGFAVAGLMLLSFPILVFGLFMTRRLRLGKVTAAMILGWLGISLGAGNLFAIDHDMGWGNYRFDEDTGWYPRANLIDQEFEVNDVPYLVSTDEYGHRNRHPYPENGEISYMVQGDSNLFGFALGVDDTLCEVLRRETGESFYNFGVSGFDVNSYYFQYERFRETFRPGLRIIFFNIGNDFGGSALRSPYFVRRPYLTVTDDGRVVEVTDDVNPITEQAYGRRFLPRYAEHDATIAAADAGMDWAESCPDWLGRIPVARFLAHYAGPRLRRFCRRYTEEEIAAARTLKPSYPYWLVLAPDDWPSPYREYSEDFPKIFARLRDQMRSDADRLLICLYPARIQVVTEDLSQLRYAIWGRFGSSTAIDRLAFNRYLIALCDQLGIEVFDTTPAFLAQPIEERARLFMADHHLSAEGLALCADALAGYLDSRGPRGHRAPPRGAGRPRIDSAIPGPESRPGSG